MGISPLNQRIADTERHRENRARLAFASSRVKSSGMGTFEFEDCIDFGLTFTERPFISTGWQVDLDQARDAFDLGPNADVKLPQVTAYVTDWNQTEREHYVGAWVAVSVTYDVEYRVDAQVKIQHDFTFSGIALKDIPYEP